MHFLNPNYHVILIHYPLGVFLLGLTIEIFSCLWRNSSVRGAARWMILLGGLATLPAATSGLYALYSLDVPSITVRGVHMLRMHVWLQSIATLLAVFTAVFALAAADSWRRRFHWIAIGVFAACGGLMVAGSWFAGESVYTQGVAVHQPTEADAKATAWSEAQKFTGQDKLLYFTGEIVQLHMIGAGVMFAIAMAALGLSIRAITSEYPDAAHLPLLPENSSSDAPQSMPLAQMLRAESPSPRFVARTDAMDDLPVPAARFWLIAALCGLLTAAGGYWLWASMGSSWSPNKFLGVMSSKDGLKFDRSAAHVWVGISLIALTLILAMLARWAPRQKTLLAIFAMLLVFAVAAQVWLGVLLTFDSGSPPASLFRFNPPDKSAAAVIAGHET